MLLDIKGSTPHSYEIIQQTIELNGYDVRYVNDYLPEIGVPESGHSKFIFEQPFEAVVCILRGIVVGCIIYFRIAQVRKDKFVIYRTEVDDKNRGKGIGLNMLRIAVERMRDQGAKDVEVVTVPDLSPEALDFYKKVGFKEASYWAIF